MTKNSCFTAHSFANFVTEKSTVKLFSSCFLPFLLGIVIVLQLNPAKLEKGADTVVNLKQLLEFLFEGVHAIVNSAGNCPR